MELIIRTENKSNFNWFKTLIDDTYNLEFKLIPEPGDSEFHNLPLKIKNILKLDKTDFIISFVNNDKETPIISLEITKSAPLTQHTEQRMARMISAAEEGVVPIFICPKILKTEDKEYNFSTKFFDLFHKIGTINRIPCMIFYYSDNNGILLDEEEYPGCPLIENENTQNFINFLKKILNESINNFNELNFNYFNNNEIKQSFLDQKDFSNGKKYDVVKMGTCSLIDTENLLDYILKYSEKDEFWIQNTFNRISNKILKRKKTLIFSTETKESRLFAHAGDPYVGMLSAIDYAFCRNGKTVDDRKANIVFVPKNNDDSFLYKVFSKQGYNHYHKYSCPFNSDINVGIDQQFEIAHHLQYGCTYTKNRPLKIYSHYCDMIVFKDAILTF